MPFPQIVARTNRYWINPITRRFAGRIPPFLLIRHVGRKSGTPYETPVWAFRRPEGFLIVLTYGPGTDWLRNLEAAGSCGATYRGQPYTLASARIVEGDPRSQPLPWPVREAVRLAGIRHVLYVTAERAQGE